MTAIACIAADAREARAARRAPDADGSISGATLVVVPAILAFQWEQEVSRASHGKLSTLVIHSADRLREITVNELRLADVVIIVVDLLGTAKSFWTAIDEHKTNRNQAGDTAPQSRRHKGAWGAIG